MAMPATPRPPNGAGPKVNRTDAATLTTFTTIMVRKGVRVSPAARRQALPTIITAPTAAPTLTQRR